MVRSPGFEPGSSAWQADVLAKLDYNRFPMDYVFLLLSLKKSYVSVANTCIVSCMNLSSSMWNRWLLQLQSEQPNPFIGLLLLLIALAVLHSSVLLAFL
jgi:hypothetical protein